MNEYDKCILDTQKHQVTVRKFIYIMMDILKSRAETHDASKLLPPEIDYFVEHNNRLPGLTYGSFEYQESLEKLKPALDHHYANERHHPQHFPNGVKGMNLVDVVEMLCDWKASSMRHNDGNILKSIDINAKRFDMSEDLIAVLRNTAELLELV